MAKPLTEKSERLWLKIKDELEDKNPAFVKILEETLDDNPKLKRKVVEESKKISG